MRAGEVLGLIGPNGAGKTTLFECLAGVLPSDAGGIRVKGQPMTPRERASLLVYLPDGIAPWPSQSVRWAIDFMLGFFGGPRSLRDDVIEQLGISPLLDRPIGALSKLRRVMSDLQVEYVSATSIGLFEQTSEHYGEIWYDLGGHKTMSRLTTAEGVLETIYDLAGVTPSAENEEDVFRGHPLAAPPKGAAAVFYGIWPAAVVASAFLIRRRSV